MPPSLSFSPWPGCRLVRPPEFSSRCTPSTLARVLTDTARHTSLIALLLLVSLSSSTGPSSSSHLASRGQPRLGIDPHLRIAQVKPSERVSRGLTRTSSNSDSDGSQSISPHSFSPQCLEKNSKFCNNATAVEVCNLPTNSRANAALTHPHFPSTCWASHSGCPPPVLTAAQVADIEGGDVGRCRSAVERLLVKVEESNLQVEGALQVLTSGWLVPGQRECGQQTCPDCKEWYRTWLCLSLWPLHPRPSPTSPPLGPLAPCPSQCSAVQTHCPFNIIEDEPSMASGDPTFLCRDSTVSPGWQQTVAAASSSNCCFEVVEPGLNSAVPPEGGFVDLNATCSHDSRTLGTGVLACDMPAGKLAMANRTLFIRSETVAVGRLSSERSGELLGRSNDGQSTTGHCHLLLKLLFSYCSWTLSQNFRIL